MDSIPPRLTSYPFPPYSYVNRLHPHPLTNPEGHGCEGGPEEPTEPPTESNWRSCMSYLWGIDLFNAGFYWEAHESWEAAWIAAGREGTVADLFRGLIKIAAAGVKARENRQVGVERHLARAVQIFEQVQQVPSDEYFGLELAEILTAVRNSQALAEAITKVSSADPSSRTLPIELICKI
ncbi:MAG: DUF309 domain-containing protein [Planctomycetota bacterium]